MALHKQIESIRQSIRSELYQVALEQTQLALNEYDEQAELYALMSQIKYKLGQKQLAIVYLKRAIFLGEEPTQELVVHCFTLTRYLINDRRFQEALVYAGKVISIEAHLQVNNFSDTIYFFKAWAYFYLEDFQSSKTSLLKISDPQCDRESFLGKLHTKDDLISQIDDLKQRINYALI
ncbi:hypothetical protein HR060_13300 [Catenovulum sp. SM1970]|uniref:hypothetical protein n=1 Tax=Marinifaba aquimaris TaxID=2741323 RepID=UPI0015731102|nr:hypothetical protein [Marinifaba aquimaris]NTS77830.1 hypothetical protein [Marinifaba aquimaris]